MPEIDPEVAAINSLVGESAEDAYNDGFADGREDMKNQVLTIVESNYDNTIDRIMEIIESL